MNTETAAKLATSHLGTTHQVEIAANGTVRTLTGVLLGDVEGMTRLGWEFTTGYLCKSCGAESPVGIGYAGQPDRAEPAPGCPNPHAV